MQLKRQIRLFTTVLALFLFAGILPLLTFAQEKIEFRGINRSGHFAETGLLKKWPEAGPDVLMKIEGAGKGYSHPILVNDKIFVTGIKKDTLDVLTAYTAEGTLLWETTYGRSWIKSYTDSRCTPVWENGKLYVSSGTGQVSCINAETGEIIWQVDAIALYSGEIYDHGDAENPLVLEDKVIFTTGGEENAVVALKKTDGSLVWKSKSLGGAKSYASPVLINHMGRKIILVQTTRHLIAFDPDKGEILWNYDLIRYHLHKMGVGANTNAPLYHNGEVFVTSGYDHPGIKLKLDENGSSYTEVWKNDTLDTHHGGVVLVGGYLYGSNWQNNAKGRWACVEWESGRTMWEAEWYNKGSIVSADGQMIIYEEKSGNVALLHPDPEQMKIISTFKVEEGVGPHWAHPYIAGGKLFIRHGDVIMVYNISETGQQG